MQLVFEGCYLEEIINSRSMSKIEFAERMGVSKSSVTHWINGRNFMTADKLFLACYILNCKPDDIYKFRYSRSSR